MEIELRLKKILQDHGLFRHGIEQEIAGACKLHRHTVGKLIHGKVRNPSLDTLGTVSEWLAANGVPRSTLPRALFSVRPSRLWRALTASRLLNIFIGEYREADTPGVARSWVARRDAEAAARITHHLALRCEGERAGIDVQTCYIPFRYSKRATRAKQARFDEDRERASRAFAQFHAATPQRSCVYLGSQRVNFLVEFFVAGLFRCEPFVPPGDEPCVPLYLVHRNHDLEVTSSFGGLVPPPGFRGKAAPGTYYLDDSGQWRVCEWLENERDAGIVIVVYDPGTQVVELALFGFSGRSTEALAEELIDRHPDQYWPPPVDAHGKKVGVYVCQFTYRTVSAGPDEQTFTVEKAEIVGLSNKVLSSYLHR